MQHKRLIIFLLTSFLSWAPQPFSFICEGIGWNWVFPIIGKTENAGQSEQPKDNIFRGYTVRCVHSSIQPMQSCFGVCWASCKVLRCGVGENMDLMCHGAFALAKEISQTKWTSGRESHKVKPWGGVGRQEWGNSLFPSWGWEDHYFSLWREDPRGWSPVSTGVVASDVREKRQPRRSLRAHFEFN